MPTALSKFSLADGEAKQARENPPGLEIVVRRSEPVLVVDQALATSGWAFLLLDPQKGFQVAWTGVATTEAISTGNEDNLLRGEAMFRHYKAIIESMNPSVIVHETPPRSSGGGVRMARPESSLVAATALRCAAMVAEIPVVMIGAQTAKKRITGNGNAKKPEVHAKLRLMLPNLANKKPMNQHILDAIALGVVYAEEES